MTRLLRHQMSPCEAMCEGKPSIVPSEPGAAPVGSQFAAGSAQTLSKSTRGKLSSPGGANAAALPALPGIPV
jgi:hypothetical protein